MADYEFIDFETSKESWNYFDISDCSVLKSKFVLILVLKQKSREAEYSLNTWTLSGIIAAEKYQGPPSGRQYSIPESIAAIEEEDLPFKVRTPDNWNVYRLANGDTLSVKLELASVSRTSLFDERGQRIYVFNLQPIVKGKLSEEKRKQLRPV